MARAHLRAGAKRVFPAVVLRELILGSQDMNNHAEKTSLVPDGIGLSWVLQRLRNIRQIRRLRKGRDVGALVELLDSEMGTLSRSDVAACLGELGSSAAVQPLVHHLHHDELVVRISAAQALGRIGDSRAVPALLRELSDREPIVRANAIAALGEIGDPAAISELRSFLDDRDSWLRGRAIYAFSLIQNPEAQEIARQRLSREPRPERNRIVKAVRKRQAYVRRRQDRDGPPTDGAT